MENRRLSASIARKIQRMLEGETLPSSTLPSWIAQELLEEGLLSVLSKGSRKSYRLIDAEACRGVAQCIVQRQPEILPPH